MSFARVYKNLEDDPIFNFLSSAGELLEITVSSMMELAKIIASKKYRHQLAVEKVYRRLLYLKEKKILLVKKQGLKMRFALSDTLKRQLLLNKFGQAKSLSRGRFLMVFFDIPESQRETRDVWRRFLKENNFQMISLSIWITRKDLYREIKNLINEFGLEDWINCCYGTDFLSLKNITYKK